MHVDEKLLLHVAEVARLKLTKQEIEEFLPQLQEILDSFSSLNEVHTDHVEPSFHPVPLTDALREDQPKPCLDQNEALKNSPHVKDGYFKGPRAV